MSATQTTADQDVTAGCCGPEMFGSDSECPCGSMMKGHKLAAFAIFSLFLAMLLVSQVGGVLGIIAFVRTL